MPTILNGKELPETNLEPANGYEDWIFEKWKEVGVSRGMGMDGALPITDTNIKDYKEVMEEDLRYIDVTIIKEIDRAYIDEMAIQKALNKES